MQVDEVLERVGRVARLAELTQLCGSAAAPGPVRAALDRCRDPGGRSSQRRGEPHQCRPPARVEGQAHPPEPTITVPRSSSRLDALGVTVHYGDVTGQVRVTDPVRTVLDCARTLPFDEARAARVVRNATAEAANPFESVLRAIAHDVAGLDVVPQGEIGDWTHPDLVDFRLRIAIEAESYEYHSLREAFEYDVHRYTGLVRERWVVLRFTWDEVMHKPAYVRTVLADVVRWRSAELALASTGSSPR